MPDLLVKLFAVAVGLNGEGNPHGKQRVGLLSERRVLHGPFSYLIQFKFVSEDPERADPHYLSIGLTIRVWISTQTCGNGHTAIKRIGTQLVTCKSVLTFIKLSIPNIIRSPCVIY